MSRAAGLILLAAMTAFAIAGPVLIEADPLRQNLRAALQPPSAVWPLGTDHLGRDVLARLAHAARASMALGAGTVALAAAIGVGLGLMAAWRGGVVERLAEASCAIAMALPGLLVVVLIAAVAPGQFWPLYLGLVFASWVEFYRPVRALAKSRLAAPDVQAARLFGFGVWHVARRHVLPELLAPVATIAAFAFAGAVLAVASLGFVGIGLRPPVPEWGNMMVELLPHYADAPVQLLAPAAAVFLAVLGLHLAAGTERAP
ncbi:MAG: ABC transporter permease [Tagaea sp.]